MLKSLEKLPSHEWCKPGASLWILPSPGESRWASLIDWYLGFRLSRLREQNWSITDDPKTQELLKSFPNFSPPLAPLSHKKKVLLIGSAQRLPNLFTMEIPFHSNWLRDTYQMWKNMGQFSVRMFLPKEVSEQDCLSLWSYSAKTSQVEYLKECT